MSTGDNQQAGARDTGTSAREELLRRRLKGGRGGAAEQTAATGRGRKTIGRADRGRPLPLSYGQQQMWFLNRLDPDSAEYLVPLAVRLRGPLDRAALREAWSQMTARHEILRTRYVMDGAAPVQVIDESCAVDLVDADLSDADADSRERRAAEMFRAESAGAFDLEREWPLRGTLVRLAEDDHVLIVVFHHIACDAWSTRLFLTELSDLYQAFADGRPSPLAEPDLQYADFAVWQREHLSGERLERELSYWRDQLDGLTPLELPTDRPRPAARSFEGAEVTVPFPAGLDDRLKKTAAQYGVTPFVVLLTAYQLVLSRYAGRQDIAVGTVVSGRGRAELQKMLGYGINSLVMRARWGSGATFGELLEANRATVYGAYDHQGVPFARLVDELEPERDMSRTPLYQVSFTMHESGEAAEGLFGLGSVPFGVAGGVAKTDLELQVVEAADGALSARLVYPVALFERGSVERVAGHWLRLLGAAVEEPSVAVARLEMLDAAERSLLASGPGVSARVERCVHEVFEERAAVAPGAVAVVADGLTLSYGEVNARANRLARYLSGLGVGPESLVGVCLERGVDLVPTLLGVLKSGAGYVPLDPVNPAERLGFVAADAGVCVVVTQSGLLSLVDGFHDGAVVVVDGADRVGIAACEASDPGVVVSPDNAVYVIYTSGSTGRPKGVALEHANVVRLLAVAQEHYAFDESDAFSLFHSYAFDVSVFEMWGALMHGGRVVVVPRGVAQSPDEFLDLLVRERVTVLSQTPSAFRSLVGAAADGDPRVGGLGLRAVIFAGEKLEVGELRPWVDRLGLEKTALVNMYGITETTVHSTYHRLSVEDFAADAGNPIGRPLGDLSIHLLDSYGNLVPVGVPGEMYVGGPGVARGYLGRPALTAERFVPDPFGPAGSRLYRSGDLARRREDGSLEFLGRIDDQVKVRGYRIELGEIETALSAYAGIRDGVVIVREDTPGDKRLVAYYVPAPGAVVDLAAVRSELGRALPEYMVPAAFVELEVLPLTPNGKLDKRALPAPEQDAFARGAYVAPRTPLEERLASVWSEVLGVERVGVEDSFFELGGDSIRAVALVGALRTTGFEVAVRDVFAARTVTALAELLDGRKTTEESAALRSVQRFALISAEDRAKLPTGVVDAYPLSRTQTGMVVEMLADTSRNHYHNVSTYRIRDDKPFSRAAFAEAGRIVVARHETLRTSIELSAYSVPMQLVHAAAEPVMGVADLGDLAVEEQHEKLREFTAAERAKAFDFAEPPLMRYFAHTTENNGWWISVTECHPIMEGWSYHSLLMELLGCYMRLRDGLEPEPYEVPDVRYADFIAGELESLASDEDRAYWAGIVSDYTKFTLPAGWNDPADAPQRTHQIPVPWHDLEDRLRALATAADASFKSVMLAAHLKVMGMLTDEPAFHTGLVFDARPEALGADRVYGMYLNTLPFPLDRGARTWRELVRQVFAREVELWGHRRFPMPEIQREVGNGRLIDVFFNYQDFRQVDTGLIDPLGGIDDSPTELPLTVSSRGGYIILTVGIPALSEEYGGRIANMYRSVLEAMAADLDGDARAVYLPKGECERLLGDAAGGAPAARVERCVHEVFEERAALDPAAVAVVAGGVELSYGEVNARANRLARYLSGLGVGPESLVGVCLERGVDLVPTLLGVLKSGAGYVPLDPVNPAERLGFVAADAGVCVVVTQSGLLSLVDGFHDGAVVVVDGADRVGIAACEASDPGVVVSPDNAVYVIYTSGSTGRPKGVALEHANVVRLLAVAQEHYAFDESDAFSLFHSYAFDVSVFEMWGALMHGGRVVVVPREVAQSPDEFLDLLVRERVTVLSQTPSAFRSLVGAAADGDPRVGELELRAVIFAGEKLEVGELRPWVDRLGLEKTALVNMYGITETTVHSTYHRLSAEDFAADAGNPIGQPLGDLSIHLLDSYGNLVPVGVPGEMYVGGPGVARGYLGRPALTAERFVPDPFGPAGSRLYRSGDLARRREDGSLEFLGRMDDQVKVRGYRIELGEIETALSGQAGIRDAVVIVREDTPGDKRLVAYFVPASGTSVDLTALRSEIGRTLPEYMVPAAFVELEALPLTPNGKLDKRALPAPEQDAFARSEYVAPRTLVEMGVASVWAQVLGLERVGVEDSFFELGGDSIRAVTLVGALRAIGFDATIQQIFQCRTIAALCEAVAGTKVPTAEETKVRGVEPFALISAEDRAKLPEGVMDAYPLSQVQTGMVVEMLADTDRNTYHGSASHWVRDDKPFSADALRKAAAVVAERHDVLRTSFDFSTCSLPLQLVHARAEIPVAVHDLRHLDDTARHQALYELVIADRDTVFDLQTAPQLRFTVFLEKEGGWRLGVTQNHAITEGWSNESLLMELIGCYMRLRDGLEPEPYDVPDVRYADFIAGELESLASDEDRAYWRGIVADYVPFALPSGWEGTAEGGGEEYALDVATADLETGLRAVAAAANASFKSVLLAAHLKVMGMLTDEPAFHTGLVCDARPEVSGADRVYGMYLNTLPVPADRDARTWRELVERTFAREVELWGHRRFPMPEIQREAGVGRLIDSLFNYQNFHHVDTEKVDTSGSFGNGVTEFALSITASPSKVALQANTRDLARVHGRRIVGMYRSVLEAMAADAEGDARVSFLPDGEFELVASRWRGVSREVGEVCLHELVEAQVERTPGAVAVVCEGVELTYAEVNVRANRLAHRLRRLGVGADSVVGLCLERSVELVVATLAVSKAGGAFVALDPEYPGDRLSGMVEDSAASVVVTERRLAEVVSGSCAEMVFFDDEAGWAGEPVGNPVASAVPDSGAYLVFTSGSTGRPKGVVNTHRGVVNRLSDSQRYLRMTSDDVVLQKTAAGFDVYAWEIFGTLMTGARLVVATRGGHRDPLYLGRMIVEHGVTVIDFVPSMLTLVLEEGGLAGCTALRAIACGGEEMPVPLVRRLLEELPGTEIYNQYGPSEASIDCTVHAIKGSLPKGLDRIPIGTPIQNVGLYVLDAELRPQLVGVPGELFIAGVGVARGYVRRAALTAERFLPDPYGEPGGRMYRTGDRARWLADGTLEYLGRTDDQVKIRGVRIEPGEVEAALIALAVVRDAAVLVREDTPGDKRLVAYYVPTAEAEARSEADPAALRVELGRSLPEHMVPAAFVKLERIPVTPNGKTDRRALPAPEQDAFARGAYVAPRTPVEERVAAVWSRVLGVERVGVEDSFFELGGDSIRAVALVGALRAAGFETSIQQVFEGRTVAALCVAFPDGREAVRGTTGVEPFALITHQDRERLADGVVDAYPLSQVQTGMVAEMLVGDEGNAYHTISTVRIRDVKPFVADALRQAWRIVAERHETLRTSVHVDEYSRPLQLVHPTADVTLDVRDLGDAGRQETEDALRAFVLAERSNHLDLAVAPLIRLFVHTTADDGWWLSFTSPHVILDGWSHESLLMELLGCYTRLRDGLEPEPYELPSVRYADFIAGELESLNSEEDRAYWRAAIDGYAAFTIPAEWGDRAKPAESYGIQVEYGDLTEDLRKAAAAVDVPLKSVLLAAHLKVMGMLTDEPAFHTGLVCHARPEAEGADRLIGMQVNTLPFVADRTARTWRELVRQVFAREVELWGHRRFPMPEIQREAGGGRLVDVLFNFVDFHQVDDGIVDTGMAFNDAPKEFGLSADATGSRISLSANTRTLSHKHGRRIADMYRSVLEAMAADLDGDARAVYLPKGERERLLGDAAGGAPAARVERCVHEAFEERAALDPAAVAVVAGGVELSYGEVNARANRLARYLSGLGVGPESLVGVCLERGVDLVPTLLGVLKSGAGYVPLDPVNPAERLGFVAADAGVCVVVTQSGLLSLVDGFHDGAVVVVDGADRVGIAACEASDPGVVVSPDNAVYVIYTSGSTGRPKGVALEHANVVRLLAVAQEHYAFDESDAFSLFHSYAFDVSVFEMWGALMHGGRVVVVPRGVAQSPDEFLDLLVRERVTVLSQTPSAFRSLVGAAADGDPRVGELELRAVIFAGEKLEVGDLQPWVSRLGLGRTALVNMYGITETTVHSTYHRLTKRDFAEGAGNPIGRPLSDLSIHLLDSYGNLVPVGVPGEMYVGGPGVARGYLGRPALTAERFVPDPFGPAGSRLYRSGDLARRREDGSLEFLGRIDDQVKIRGYRIELGEIETALSAYAGIRDGVVIVREDTPGDKRLVAYYVPAPGAVVDLAAVRSELGLSLPEYMVPAAFVELETLPLTPNGKLDKRALPAPEQDAFARGAYVAPRDETEARIATVWSEVLGLDEVSVEDSFFDLGGDSIRAVSLVGALRVTGIDTTMQEVFAARTVAAMAANAADGRRTSAAHQDTVAVRPFALITDEDRGKLPTAVVDAYPLTQAQTGMVVEMLAKGGARSYHNVASLRVRGEEFSLDALRTALDVVAERHDVLRTTIDLETYSVPMQLVHAAAEIPLTVEDLTGLAASEAEQALRDFVTAESEAVFDLGRAPLMRVAVHLCADGSWQFTLTEAHAIIDGWSYHSLLAELVGLFRQLRDEREPDAWTPLAVRFADAVAGELASLRGTEDRAYWQRIVDGYAKFQLPAGWADAPDTPREQYEIEVGYADLEDSLRALAAASGASVKSVVHAAHQKVVSMLTDEPVFHTGLTCHIRPEAVGSERAHGMYLNVLPFAADREARTWSELVQRVFARETELWEHRMFPMPTIQRELAGGERLIDVHFSYQDFRAAEQGAAGDDGQGTVDVASSMGASSNEFSLFVVAGQNRLNVITHTHAVGRAHGERVARMFRTVLEAMAENPDATIDSASLLPAGELHRLLTEWNASAAPFEDGVSLHELVERQAVAVPDAPAVVGEDGCLTFAELDARANQVARVLRGLGVGPESVVGVLLDRGVALMVCLLGVWKAGGAYVPLDPSYPAERVDAMLSDAGARVVLTQERYEELFAGFEGRVLSMDDARVVESVSGESVESPGVPGDADRLAYVIYTSGSTGRPKGVQVAHRGLVNHVVWAARELAGRGVGGAPVFSSVAFDLVVPNLWAPLVAGQRVCLLAQDVDLGELGRRLVEAGPFSFVKLTPGHLEVLTHQLSEDEVRALAGVWVVAGEAFSGGLAERWAGLLGAGRVINEYGPTEASVGTCTFPVDGPVGVDVVPIGRPLPNMAMYVLDRGMVPVPVGVPGELYVGGVGVARGYVGRAGLTAERFVPDPFGGSGGRLYRTGDVVRLLPDGNVDFIGRADMQVKIRGYRIEPEEIQAVLAEHPAVREVTVVARENQPGDKRLVAYYVPADGPVPAEELAGFCGVRLPAYMVPAAFVELEAMPLNANGKIDRRALPAPDFEAPDAGRQYVEPATPTERRLADIWAEALGRERVGAEDNFFDLGGHSILIIKVVSAARQAGLPLSLFMLYQHATLRGLATEVDAAMVAEAAQAPQDQKVQKDQGEKEAQQQEAGRQKQRQADPDTLLGGIDLGVVPGVSVAVIEDGDLVAVEAAGTLLAGGADPVTPETVFQVGSVSKHVVALGLLRLADQGVIDLDEDVNRYLTSWRVPGPDGTEPPRITSRQLLGHLSGLLPTPGKGYLPGTPVPSLLDMLNGRTPDGIPAVCTDLAPGEVFRKANVHYSVLQQVMTDVTGESFPELMRALVLDPLGMTGSSFEQSFPETSGRPVALGHDEEGRAVDGGWRVRADMAAAGLWATAADLAKVALEVRRSFLGRPLALLARQTARQLLTPHAGSFYGLGTVVDDTAANEVQFGHGGEPVGYQALTMARVRQGSGVVVLANSSGAKDLVKAVADTVASGGSIPSV